MRQQRKQNNGKRRKKRRKYIRSLWSEKNGDWITPFRERALRWVKLSRHLKHTLLKIRLIRNSGTLKNSLWYNFFTSKFNLIYKKGDTLFIDECLEEEERKGRGVNDYWWLFTASAPRLSEVIIVPKDGYRSHKEQWIIEYNIR